MNDLLVLIGLIIAIIGMLDVIPILVLVSVLFVIPKIIWIVAMTKDYVYNEDEDDI